MATERRFRWLAPLLLTIAWLLLMAVALFTAFRVSESRPKKDKPTERPAYVRA